MEQTTDAEKAMAVFEFLDSKRKNKVGTQFTLVCYISACFVSFLLQIVSAGINFLWDTNVLQRVNQA